jgi:adenylate cyclase
MAEKLGGEEIINILGEYFEEMWLPLSENGAWVDKYVGDLVMAAWNILQPMEDHAIRAVCAAVGMKVALAELNRRRAEQNLDPLKNGIGIHTGDLVCGNVGSSSRSNFTIIGDTVNLASRIEYEARGGEILISEKTYELVKDRVNARNWGTVPIKGKRGQYTIYEVEGLVGGPSVVND